MAEGGSTEKVTGSHARDRGRRVPLNRERVLRAAVALADEVGVAGLTMRRLAQQLGVVPMALYKHVSDKDELLDGMVDVVISEVDPPDPALDWKDGVRQRVLSTRRAVLRHTWLRSAIESRTRRTPTVLEYMDSMAGTLLAGGLTADLTHHVMHALGNRIWGFSPELFDEPRSEHAPPLTPATQASGAAEFGQRYPHILQIALAATQGDLDEVRRGCDEQFEFEFALDLLLDGAQRLQQQGWSSRTPRALPSSSRSSAPAV